MWLPVFCVHIFRASTVYSRTLVAPREKKNIDFLAFQQKNIDDLVSLSKGREGQMALPSLYFLD